MPDTILTESKNSVAEDFDNDILSSLTTTGVIKPKKYSDNLIAENILTMISPNMHYITVNPYSLACFVGYEKNPFLTSLGQKNIWQFLLTRAGEDYVRKQQTIEPLVELDDSIRNVPEFKEVQTILIGSSSTVKKLKQFALLKKGWDSYDADEIEWSTISVAVNFYSGVLLRAEGKNKKALPIPFVSPISDGGIQFEWMTHYKELIIEIGKDKTQEFEYLKVEKTLDGEKEEEDKVLTINDAIQMVIDWL